MKYLLSIIMLSFCLLSYSQKQKVISSAQHIKNEFNDDVHYSKKFLSFWNDFTLEIRWVKSIKSYSPSKKIIEKYKLQKEDKVYIISGFLKVNSDFKTAQFISNGGILLKFSEEDYSFTFPLNNLDKFIGIKGITAVDLSCR